MRNTRLFTTRSQAAYCILIIVFLLMLPASQVLAVPPIAVDDTYTMDANTTLSVLSGTGITANDTGFSTATHLITAYDIRSRFGGSVVVNGNGAFTYTPPAGFTGADTFTYELETDEGTSRATVTIIVAGPVTWFVDQFAAAGGNGTYSAPFNNFTLLNNSATDVDAPGERIYVFEGNYLSGLTLEANQELIGSGVEFFLPNTGITIPVTTAPNINGTITLANNDTIRGVRIPATAGDTAIFANAIDNFTMMDSEIAILSGVGFEFINVTGNVSIARTVATGNSAFNRGMLDITGGTANITFSDTSRIQDVEGGYAARVTNFEGALTFDNTTLISALSGRGIHLQGLTAAAIVTFDAIDMVTNFAGFTHINNDPLSTVVFNDDFRLITPSNPEPLMSFSAGRVTINSTGNRIESTGNVALMMEETELTQNATLDFVSATNVIAGPLFYGINIVNPVGNHDLIVNTGTFADISQTAINVAHTAASNFTLAFQQLTVDQSTNPTGRAITVNNAAVEVNNPGSIIITTTTAIQATNARLNIALNTLTSQGGVNAVNLDNVNGFIDAAGGTLNSTSGATNHVINILNSTLDFTHNGTINKSTQGRLLNVDGLTSVGSVTLGGTVTATNASNGIRLANSTVPVSFGTLNLGTSGARFAATPITLASVRGSLDLGLVTIYTAAATAFESTSVTGAYTVTTDTGSLIDSQGTAINIGAGFTQTLNMQFVTVNASGASAYGIRLNATAGTFTIATSATITAKTTAGVEINSSSTTFTVPTLNISNSTDGVRLISTTGSFTITGDGNTALSTNGAGGTFNNLTSNGFEMSNATNITLDDLVISNIGDDGMFGTGVVNMTLRNVDFINNGNALNDHAMDFFSLTGSALTGTVLIEASEFNRFANNGIYIQNVGGTLNLTVRNTSFLESDEHTFCSGFGCDSQGMLLRADGNGSMTVMVDNVTFDDLTQVGIDAARQGTANMNITVQNSRFDPVPYMNNIDDTDNAIRLYSVSGTGGRMDFLIRNNIMGDTADGNDADGDDFRGVNGIIIIEGGGPNSTMEGVIRDNVIADVRNTSAVYIDSDGFTPGTSTMRVKVENNVIRNHFNHGINNIANGSTGGGDNHFIDIAILNNRFETGPNGAGVNPINISGGDRNRMCVRATGNSGVTAGSPIVLGTATTAIRIRHTGLPATGQFQLETLTPFTNNSDVSADNAVTTDNNNSTVTVFTSNALTNANCTADTLSP